MRKTIEPETFIETKKFRFEFYYTHRVQGEIETDCSASAVDILKDLEFKLQLLNTNSNMASDLKIQSISADGIIGDDYAVVRSVNKLLKESDGGINLKKTGGV